MRAALYIIAFSASLAIAQSSGSVYGSLNVQDVRFTFGSDSAIQIRILPTRIDRDTSPSDTAGAWKRQDNTADSCSNPAYIGRSVQPNFKFTLSEMVYARDPDTSATGFRFQVRWPRLQFRGDTAWGPWVRAGNGKGYGDVSVLDSIQMPNIGGTAATWQARYAWFFLGEGEQIRVCPYYRSGFMGSQSSDTLIERNIRFRDR